MGKIVLLDAHLGTGSIFLNEILDLLLLTVTDLIDLSDGDRTSWDLIPAWGWGETLPQCIDGDWKNFHRGDGDGEPSRGEFSIAI